MQAIAEALPHHHEWQPLPGWPTRYRCGDKDCQAIGYRGQVGSPFAPLEAVVSYACNKRSHGVDCSKPAILVDKGKHRCRDHRDRKNLEK